MWMESDVIMVYRGFILKYLYNHLDILGLPMLSWVLRTRGYIIIHWSVCVCVWIYYSEALMDWPCDCFCWKDVLGHMNAQTSPPLFRGFLEDWKTENHPVYNIFYWWISHQIEIKIIDTVLAQLNSYVWSDLHFLYCNDIILWKLLTQNLSRVLSNRSNRGQEGVALLA